MDKEPIVVRTEDVKGSRTAFGDLLRWVVGADEVSEAFSLHHRTAPAGSASVPHSHKRVTEAFYVLSGRFEFEVGNRKVDAGPGTYVQAPKGVSHAWRVAGEEPAEALVFFSPSVAREFFQEVDAEVRTGGGNRDRLYEINVKYGLD